MYQITQRLPRFCTYTVDTNPGEPPRGSVTFELKERLERVRRGREAGGGGVSGRLSPCRHRVTLASPHPPPRIADAIAPHIPLSQVVMWLTHSFNAQGFAARLSVVDVAFKGLRGRDGNSIWIHADKEKGAVRQHAGGAPAATWPPPPLTPPGPRSAASCATAWRWRATWCRT